MYYLKSEGVGTNRKATVTTGDIEKEIENMYQETSDVSVEGVTRTWTYGEWKIEEKTGEEVMTFSVDSKVTIVLTKACSRRSNN